MRFCALGTHVGEAFATAVDEGPVCRRPSRDGAFTVEGHYCRFAVRRSVCRGLHAAWSARARVLCVTASRWHAHELPPVT